MSDYFVVDPARPYYNHFLFVEICWWSLQILFYIHPVSHNNYYIIWVSRNYK